jgi:hypothetical protein
MLKKYIRMFCFLLATMCTLFFAGNAYSATVGQPQLDTAATAVNAPATDTVMAVAAANPTVQANGSATNQQPTSANGKNIEYEMFRDTEGKAK